MDTPPLRKAFENGTLTRAGGDVLIEMYGPVYAGPGSRWSFRIIAETDKKGRMRADVEYYLNSEFPKKTKLVCELEDFAEEVLVALASKIVREATAGVAESPNGDGIRLFRITFRSVIYTANLLAEGTEARRRNLVVSMQARKMQLSTSEYASEPCVAEVSRTAFRGSSYETPANGLTIDDAYAAVLRVRAGKGWR